MSKVIYFEIHAEDPKRAMQFYSDLLGWKFQKWDGPIDYWNIVAGKDDEKGINGGLLQRQGASPQPMEKAGFNTFMSTVRVESVDKILETVQKKYGFRTVPKIAAPGKGWLAFCEDSEGNTFGVMEEDINAK
jgi:predicted enzyme related to lactoylglutathione lyase